MSYEALYQLVLKRRSIRRFKPDPVPDDLVLKLLEVARWAPSGANSQPWEFIVVRDREAIGKIAEAWMKAQEAYREIELSRRESLRWPRLLGPIRPPPFKDAPVLIVVCGDPRTMDAYPLYIKLERGDQVFYSSLANVVLLIHLAAASLGLGSQQITASSCSYLESVIKRVLGIPEELKVYEMIAVGYPAMEPRPRPVKPLDQLVHYDRYDLRRFKTLEEVRKEIEEGRRYFEEVYAAKQRA